MIYACFRDGKWGRGRAYTASQAALLYMKNNSESPTFPSFIGSLFLFRFFFLL